MADALRARVSEAIVRFLEPHIQSIITERILKYDAHLVGHGAIKRITHNVSSEDRNTSSGHQHAFVENYSSH